MTLTERLEQLTEKSGAEEILRAFVDAIWVHGSPDSTTGAHLRAVLQKCMPDVIHARLMPAIEAAKTAPIREPGDNAHVEGEENIEGEDHVAS